MDIAKRIQLIRAISKKLAEEPTIYDINFVLRQYGFDAYDGNIDDWFDGNVEYYTRNIVERSTDETLEELSMYCGIDTNNLKMESLEPTFWSPNRFKLFISHCSNIREQAEGIKNALKPYFISSFVAHTDINVSSKWRPELQAALNTMDTLLAIVTDDFQKSDWTDQEVGWALGRNVNIIPLMANGQLNGFLEETQAINLGSKTYAELAREIFVSIIKIAPSKDIMASILLQNSKLAIEKGDNGEIIDILEKFLLFDRLRPENLKALEVRLSTVSYNQAIQTTFANLSKKHNYSSNLRMLAHPDMPTDVNDIPF